MKVGVLVPKLTAEPEAPEARPIGRAALKLASEGIDVVFGHHAAAGRLTGVRAEPGGWVVASNVDVVAVYDRFPSRTQATAYATLVNGLGSVPRANPPALVELCTDKLASQRVLVAAGLPMPPVQADPAGFARSLAAWGRAFLKPRYGAFGRGVRRVQPGDALPARGEGAIPGVAEPLFLQRAVPPPTGWSGVACRVLVQRTPTGDWHVETPVARRHRSDPVVNAARGAEVVPLDTAAPGAAEAVREVARAAAVALGSQPHGAWLVEIGADVVIDNAGEPWLIEVNSRPRGRLEALAGLDPQRFADAHVEACARPLRFLAAQSQSGS